MSGLPVTSTTPASPAAGPADIRQRAPRPPEAARALLRAVFWVSFPLGILNFVLPIYGRELGASAVQVGGFFSALSVVPVLIRPFLGRILDRWGRRPFLLVGLAGYAVAMTVFAIADQVWLLTLGMFLQGMGQAFLWLTAMTVVADVATATGRGQNFGLLDEATNRGAIVGSSIGMGGLILSQIHPEVPFEQAWRLMFLGYIGAAAVALWHAWRGVPETRPQAIDHAVERKPFSAQLGALMGIVFVTGASAMMVWPLLMIYLQDALAAGPADLALAYLPAAVISSILPSRTGFLADRFGRRGLMSLGLVVGAGASALMPHLGSVLALAALWAVESVGYAASVPAERAFVADIAGRDTRGASYGLYTFAYYLGAALGPLAGGWLYDNVGAEMPFYLNSTVLLLGALLVWSVLREATPRARP